MLSFLSCQMKNLNIEKDIVANASAVTNEKSEEEFDQTDSISKINKYSDLVPKNFIIFEELHGDLNKDGIDDLVLIIKDTDKDYIVHDENRRELDRNRRGIIIAFNKNSNYEPVITNYSCFSSENEDGGAYFAPELWIEINKKGNLGVHYNHGKYGLWGYIFRYQNNDFEMIGYSSESNNLEAVGLFKTSINFSTKKILTSKNIDEDCERGEEKWVNTWSTIENKPLIKLSEIVDFDEISLGEYIKSSN